MTNNIDDYKSYFKSKNPLNLIVRYIFNKKNKDNDFLEKINKSKNRVDLINEVIYGNDYKNLLNLYFNKNKDIDIESIKKINSNKGKLIEFYKNIKDEAGNKK